MDMPGTRRHPAPLPSPEHLQAGAAHDVSRSMQSAGGPGLPPPPCRCPAAVPAAPVRDTEGHILTNQPVHQLKQSHCILTCWILASFHRRGTDSPPGARDDRYPCHLDLAPSSISCVIAAASAMSKSSSRPNLPSLAEILKSQCPRTFAV